MSGVSDLQKEVPVTILTGFLGAGKTTALLSVLSELRSKNPDYKACWLKNEFGDVAVDSVLAKHSGAVAVKEILSGCICCNVVGTLDAALEELIASYSPDRIFLETSGSAFPAPLAWEVRRLQKNGAAIRLDAIVCVIDCLNFSGYEDTSYTAKVQAKYTDLILLNKHELATPQQLEKVVDQVMELNPDTAVVRTEKGSISADLLLGLDSKLLSIEKFAEQPSESDPSHHANEVELLGLRCDKSEPFDFETFERFLKELQCDTFYRVKGCIWLRDSDGNVVAKLLNFAFERWEWHPYELFDGNSALTFMGAGIYARQKWLTRKLKLQAHQIRKI